MKYRTSFARSTVRARKGEKERQRARREERRCDELRVYESELRGEEIRRAGRVYG